VAPTLGTQDTQDTHWDTHARSDGEMGQGSRKLVLYATAKYVVSLERLQLEGGANV